MVWPNSVRMPQTKFWHRMWGRSPNIGLNAVIVWYIKWWNERNNQINDSTFINKRKKSYSKQNCWFLLTAKHQVSVAGWAWLYCRGYIDTNSTTVLSAHNPDSPVNKLFCLSSLVFVVWYKLKHNGYILIYFAVG